jgi:hypothetical protein
MYDELATNTSTGGIRTPEVTSLESLVNDACTAHPSRSPAKLVIFKVVTARSTVAGDMIERTDSVAGVIMADSGSNLE